MSSQNKQAIEVLETAMTNAGKRIIHHFGYVLFAGYLLVAAIGFFTTDRDDTDGQKRSNMALRTDYGTGCQYLESSRGAITPRLSVDGKHVGCKGNYHD